MSVETSWWKRYYRVEALFIAAVLTVLTAIAIPCIISGCKIKRCNEQCCPHPAYLQRGQCVCDWELRGPESWCDDHGRTRP